MSDRSEVAANIYLIDNQLYSIPGMGSVYLVDEEKKAIIDAGPSASANTVLEGVRRFGVEPEAIDYIIITHVHLDHSGGAGHLLKSMPQAKVIVHHKGAWHIANPAKLVQGMRQAQGEEYFSKCGEVIPVPSSRIQGVGDGDTLELSGRQRLRFIDAPGHAPHQLSIFETRNGGVFTGEAAGSLLGDGKILFPFNSPPSFDLAGFINTIGRLLKLNATAIYYSHFGVTDRGQENLKLMRQRVMAWDNIVSRALASNRTDGIAEEIAAEVHKELELAHSNQSLYDFILMNIPVCAAAYLKYYQGKQ